jgi:diadenosine tetraphosphate (Ap4A) HIT family hydrolase
MAKWHSADWDGLHSGGACPICKDGKPRGILLDLGAVSYLTSTADAPMRGYCCLVFKRHVVELDELSEDEGRLLMRDIGRVTAALRRVTDCVKLNYEIHGNTIPHLHVHLFPRYRGDPFEDGPINPRSITTSPYQGSEYAEFCAELCSLVAQVQPD